MNYWNETETKSLRELYPSASKRKIMANIPDRSWHFIKTKAFRLGIKRTYHFCCKPEKLLDGSPESFYWMGFLMADGHFGKKGIIEISLSVRDINHLKRLGKFIEYKGCYTFSRQNRYVRIQFQHQNFYQSVIKRFNISNRKTYNPPQVEIFEQMSDIEFFSFFAGYVDGDGHIRQTPNTVGMELKIKLHDSWLPILQYFSKRIGKMTETLTHPPKLPSEGGALLVISNFKTIRLIKEFILPLKLPLMKRKWNKININLRTKSEISEVKLRKAIILYKSGLTRNQIHEKLGIDNCYLNKGLSGAGLI